VQKEQEAPIPSQSRGVFAPVFKKFRKLKQKPYRGNQFWSRGYCVNTVGLDEETVQKYIKDQEKEARRQE